MFFAGLVLTLHTKFNNEKETKQIVSIEQTAMVSETQSTVNDAPPLPEDGLPAGWTMEQWKWYGHEYLEDLK